MLNIVIPARNEYPQLVWTIYSFLNDIPKSTPHRIVVVSNGENPETKQMDEWLQGGKLARTGKLKVISLDEALHPYKAIQHAVETENLQGLLCYSCGHIALQRDTIPKMMKLANHKNVGLVHSPMLYMGDITDKTNTWKLYGYKHPITRGWSFRRISDKPYKWFGGGGGLSMVKLSDWHEVKAVDAPFRRGIGGIEEFLDLKMWMFNKSVWIHPDCLYYHWAKTRNYTWKMHEHYWNQLVAYYCLKGRAFMEQKNREFSYPQGVAVLDEVEMLCVPHRRFIQENAKFTLDEVLEKQPWLN